MTNKENKNWEKELKEIIGDIVSTFIGGGNLPDIIELRMPKIRQLLKAQKKEIIEKVKILKSANTEDNMISVDERMAKDSAYAEILKLIEEKQK